MDLTLIPAQTNNLPVSCHRVKPHAFFLSHSHSICGSPVFSSSRLPQRGSVCYLPGLTEDWLYIQSPCLPPSLPYLVPRLMSPSWGPGSRLALPSRLWGSWEQATGGTMANAREYLAPGLNNITWVVLDTLHREDHGQNTIINPTIRVWSLAQIIILLICRVA